MRKCGDEGAGGMGTRIYYLLLLIDSDFFMAKHTIDINESTNLKIKILKTQYGLNNVSGVIEKVFTDIQVVVK